MADDSGTSGILGVIIGVVVVVAIGLAVLSYTGNMPFGNSRSVDVNVKTPSTTPTPK